MFKRRLDRISLDVDLLVARRRADDCTHGSPSWDAAMGLVQELEDELREVEAAPDAAEDRLELAPTGN